GGAEPSTAHEDRHVDVVVAVVVDVHAAGCVAASGRRLVADGGLVAHRGGFDRLALGTAELAGTRDADRTGPTGRLLLLRLLPLARLLTRLLLAHLDGTAGGRSALEA